MRRIMMFQRLSADGSFAAADGRMEWVVPEPELDRDSASNTNSFDAVLFGRRTYDIFASFWPNVQGDAPGFSPEMRAFAAVLNAAQKLVFSRHQPTLPWRGSQLLGAFDAEQVAALKRRPGKDILVFGSGAIAALLAQHGLIDEYQLVLSPLLLGGGRPLFAGLPASVPLRLLQAKSYPAGNVMLRYAPAG